VSKVTRYIVFKSSRDASIWHVIHTESYLVTKFGTSEKVSGTSIMNLELEPPEKFSEPPKSATDTPTFNHT
jgi:hypothetical protein